MDTKECIEILSEEIEFWEDKIQTSRHSIPKKIEALKHAVKMLRGNIQEPTLF